MMIANSTKRHGNKDVSCVGHVGKGMGGWWARQARVDRSEK